MFQLFQPKKKTDYTHPELDEDTNYGLIFCDCDDENPQIYEPMGYVTHKGIPPNGDITDAVCPKYRGRKYQIGDMTMGMGQILLRGICLELHRNGINQFVVCHMGSNKISGHCIQKYLNDSFCGISVTATYDEESSNNCGWDGHYYNVVIK